MTLDDNSSFLEEQRRTFRAALKNTTAIVIARESQVTQLREELMSMRAKIRTIRETLVSDERLSSMEAIRKRIELEGNINRRRVSLEQFQVKLGRFQPFSDHYPALKASLLVRSFVRRSVEKGILEIKTSLHSGGAKPGKYEVHGISIVKNLAG